MNPHLPRRRRSPLATAIAAAFFSLAAAAPAHAIVYSWDSGTLSSTGLPASMGVLDTLSIVAGGYKYVDTGLSTAGSVTWSDTLYFVNGNSIVNSGSWSAINDSQFADSGYSGSFVNNGVFAKTGGSGSTTIGGVSFVNSGTLDAQTGSIVFTTSSTTFNAGTQFTGAGVVRVDGGASFNGAFSSQNLVLAGGTFVGNGAVLSGSATFSGGSFAGDWRVAAGQGLAVQAGGYKYVNGSITNQGSVSLGDTLYLQNGNTFTNQSLVTLAGDVGFADGGYAGTLDNRGTLRKASGSGASSISSLNFVNSGTIDVQSGRIEFNGGSATFNAGSSFTGPGQVVLNSGGNFNGAFTSQNLQLVSGTYTGNAAQINGTVVMTGGSFGGSWQVAAGQTLQVQPGGYKYVNGSVNNLGTVAATDHLYLQNGSTFTNHALYDLQGDVGLGDGGYSGYFNNNGVLRKSAGTDTSSFSGLIFTNSGEINAQTGTINFASGTLRFNDGSNFTGPGQVLVSSSATFVGGFTTQNNLTLTNGTYYGGDGNTPGSMAVMNGNTVMRGGTLQGSWQVAAGTTLSVQSGGGYSYNNGSVGNLGTVAATDSLYLQNGASFNNQALYDLRGDVGLGDGGYSGYFNNNGVLRKSAGTDTSTISGLIFTNNGEVNAQTGTINFASGTLRFNDGSSFTGPGQVLVSSSAMFVGGYTTQSNLTLTNGTYYGGDGNTPGSSGVMNGNTVMRGGTLQGNWQVGAGSTLGVQSGGGYNYVNGTVTITGNVVATDSVYLQNGSNVANKGRYELSGDVGVGDGGYSGFFVNTGLVVKTTGTGTSNLNTVYFSNAVGGVVDVRTGSIQLPDNFSNAGKLMGVGNYIVNGTLFNAGHVAPGASPGTLGLTGNYAQAAGGFFDVEVNSRNVHDLFNVSGSVTLDGTLAVACWADCSLAVGDEFVVLDYNGTRSGSFAGLSLSGFATGAFQIVYDDLDSRVLLVVTQNVTAAVPEPGSWALMFGGLAALSWLTRRRLTA